MGQNKKILLLAALLIALMVLSCGIGSAMDVQLSIDPAQATAGDSVEITALVLDNSVPVNNILVNFTTNLGNLNQSSAYTNESGIAVVTLNSISPGTATVNATINQVGDSTDYIYAFSGNNESYFWRYNITADSWAAMQNTTDPVDYGGALAYDGNNYIYGLRGGGHGDFWKYDISTDSWTYLNNTPEVIDKGGALAYDGNSYIYALQGGASTNFWRYDIAANLWTSMNDTPKVIKRGGALVHDGNSYIYVLKGYDTTPSEFWRYDIAADSWTAMQNAPEIVDAGGALAYDENNYIYAFPGGDARKFWKYDIAANSWEYMSNPPNRVNQGGAMAYDGNKYIYGFEGGLLDGFWRYDPTNISWDTMQITPGPVGWGGALVLATDSDTTSVTNSTDVNFKASTTGSPASLKVETTQTQLTVGNIAEVDITAYDEDGNINSTAEVTLNINVTDLFGSVVHQFSITKTPYTLTQIEIDKDNVIFTNSTIGTPELVLTVNSTIASDIEIKTDVDFLEKSIYAFRGDFTSDFWKYDLHEGTWTSMQSTPGSVSYGGSLAYDENNYIYAFKGSSDNFWRYNITSDSWEILPSALGTVSYGGALAYDGDDRIYALKGYSDKFWSYNITENSWQNLKVTPEGVSSGGALAFDGDNSVYAFDGFSVDPDLWKYSITSDSWSNVKAPPENVRRGGALVYDGGHFMYAFRGSDDFVHNSDFWRYNITSNSWSSVANAPGNVYWGGSLAHDGENYIYAFQGGSDQFWRYDIAADSWETIQNAPQDVSEGGSLALASTVTNTIDLRYSGDIPASIEIEANKTASMAGEVTEVNITSYDQYHNVNTTSEFTLLVNALDISGGLIHEINITKVPYTLTEIFINSSSVTLTNTTTSYPYALLNINSTMAGNINIRANIGSITNTTDVEIVPAEPHELQPTYDAQHLVNTTSTITVEVLDRYNNPVNNSTVLFTATPPADTEYNSNIEYNSLYIAPGSYTTAQDGKASATFMTDKRAGANVINMSVQDTSVNESITVTGIADNAVELLLFYTEGGVYANNIDKHKLSAKPVDQFLNPVIPDSYPIEEHILFESEAKTTLLAVNSKGIASTYVGPTPYIENVTVTATYKNATGLTSINNSTTLEFIGSEPESIVTNVNPDTLLTKGYNSTLTFTVLDPWGHTLPDYEITLENSNTTVGNITVSGVNETNLITTNTNSNGKVIATFTSKDAVGNSTITATCGPLSVSTMVRVKIEPHMQVEISAEPENVESGGTINVTTLVTVVGELTDIARPPADSILVLDCSGSMDPDSYAGTPLDVVLVMDRSGSMRYSKIADAKVAGKDFVDQMLSNAKVGLVSFAYTSSIDQPLTQMNSLDNKTVIKDDIDSLYASGYTAMGDGMADANDMLQNGRADSNKIMIVLTDGRCNRGDDRDGSQAIIDANANDVTIYTIGLGSSRDIDEGILRDIASGTGGKYYHAPTSSELRDIYVSIANEISDYDISKIEYGVEGFTLYNYEYEDSIGASETFVDTFDVDANVNDLKVQLNWENSATNLNLELTSPTGTVYGAAGNTIGYYYNDDTPRETMEYIWITPLKDTYPDTDTVEDGIWTVRVNGATSSENFNITNYIDKKSASKLASHAYLSTFNESQGDKAGLVTYSNDYVNNTNIQTSYLHNNSEWLGYFMVDYDGTHFFNLTWDDASALNISLYDGVNLLTTSTSGTSPRTMDYPLLKGKKYNVVVNKDSSTANDTQFMINVTVSPLNTALSSYYDKEYPNTPRFRQWDGTKWINELSANSVGATPKQLVMEYSPIKNEIIMGVQDSQSDLNLQVWDGVSWGTPFEASTSTTSDKRGFDIAYEQVSGRPMVVYMNASASTSIPQYRVLEETETEYKIMDMYGNPVILNVTTWTAEAPVDKNYVYALGGHSRTVFWRYDIDSNSWDTMADTPSTVRDGGDLAYDGGNYVYALRGDLTTDFWRYDITANSWTSLANTSSIVEEGGDLAYDGGNYIYAISGNMNTDFWRYNIATNSWDNMAATPGTVEEGGDLAYDGGNYVYALRGNFASDFWRYNIATNSWDNMTATPNTVSEGGNLAYDGGNYVYVLRGGSSTDFWRYDITANSWTNLTSTPAGVADGGSISYDGNNYLYAFRGSTTEARSDFWRYDISANSWTSMTNAPAPVGEGGELSEINTNGGAGTIKWIELAANPNSNEIVMVSLDTAGDIWGYVWDGSNWGNPISITNDAADLGAAGTDYYQCFDVVYEQTSGTAMVVWGENSLAGGDSTKYVTWDGTSWSAITLLKTYTEEQFWVKLAADPNSDRILMGSLSKNNEVNANVWDGSAWDTSLAAIESSAPTYSTREIDVAFEQESGRGMIVWADPTATPKYKIWDGTWGPETSASSINQYPQWVQLTPDPHSNEMFMLTSSYYTDTDEDDNSTTSINNIYIQRWDGSSWTGSEVETNSSVDTECFDFTYNWREPSAGVGGSGGSGDTNASMSWTQWGATVASSFENDSLVHLNSTIDTIGAIGLTAIDEGLYEANNELEGLEVDPEKKPVIILMTDGIDNVGHHSLRLEAYRAKANNTTIHTVGFGSSESDVDPILAEIAQITGGTYYYAPSASALESIFHGIAMDMVAYNVEGPILNMNLPKQYDNGMLPVSANYVTNSSNCTTGKFDDFTLPTYPGVGNAEPNMTVVGDQTLLSWSLPNMATGDKWGLWYQLSVEGSGYVPFIMGSSNLTYFDAASDMSGNLTQKNVSVKQISEVSVSIGGSMAEVTYPALESLNMKTVPVITIDDTATIAITVTDDADNPAAIVGKIYTSFGSFIDSTGNLQSSMDLNMTGYDTFNYTSSTAGKVHITVVVTNVNDPSDTITTEGVMFVRPKGTITIS